MKALVADDSRAIRTILKNAMINAGFEVAEAEDGRQALTKLDAHGPYDVALKKRCKKNWRRCCPPTDSGRAIQGLGEGGFPS